MKISRGMKIVYIILFIVPYLFLISYTEGGITSYIFPAIILIPTCFFISWVIPAFFKDAIVPFVKWLDKHIPPTKPK